MRYNSLATNATFYIHQSLSMQHRSAIPPHLWSTTQTRYSGKGASESCCGWGLAIFGGPWGRGVCVACKVIALCIDGNQTSSFEGSAPRYSQTRLIQCLVDMLVRGVHGVTAMATVEVEVK